MTCRNLNSCAVNKPVMATRQFGLQKLSVLIANVDGNDCKSMAAYMKKSADYADNQTEDRFEEFFAFEHLPIYFVMLARSNKITNGVERFDLTKAAKQ